MRACPLEGTAQPDQEERSPCQWFRIHSARAPGNGATIAEADDGASGVPEGSGTPPGSVVTMNGSAVGGSLATEGCTRQFPLPASVCALEPSASLATSDTTAADMESHEAGSVELGIDRVRHAWSKRVSLVDQKQAELFDAQWQFLRDQMSSFSHEIVSMRDDLRCLLERAVQDEVRDRMIAWQQGKELSAELVGEVSATPKNDMHHSLNELRAALETEVLQRKECETRLMGRFHDCLRVAEEAASGQASLAEQFKALRADLRSSLTIEAAARSGKCAELEQQMKSLREHSAQESLKNKDNHKQALDALQKVQVMVASIKRADDVPCQSSRNSAVLENEIRALRDEIAEKEQKQHDSHDSHFVEAMEGCHAFEFSFGRASDERAVRSRARWEDDDGALEQALEGLFASVGALQGAIGREAQLRSNDTEELRQLLCDEMSSFRAHTSSHWETELQRIWGALETHTHDVRMDVPEQLDSSKHKPSRTQARQSRSPDGARVKRFS